MAFDRREARAKRHLRVRKNVVGTAEKPRLCVFRSNVHIYAQLIDDATGHTVAAAGTVEPGLREQFKGNGGNVDAAKAVGALVAQRAKEKGIEIAVFDRAGYLYHGRVAALANAAREAGLKF
ncbi:MAG TPA: 50S ribosomal protein L18 [Armatimonadota bacterium]|jgi:large subunit ribosomal protein L18